MTEPAEKNIGLDAETVSKFLADNPQFFIENEDILLKLNFKHSVGNGAISFIEHQVAKLKQSNTDLNQSLENLLSIARENETLSANLMQLASGLLSCHNVSEVLASVEDVMRDVFKIEFVALRLLNHITDDSLIAIDEETESSLFAEFFTRNKPVCGEVENELNTYFFPGNQDIIKSTAIIPLKGVEHLGALALASTDGARFTDDKGLIFLSHIGDLISSALLAHLHA